MTSHKTQETNPNRRWIAAVRENRETLEAIAKSGLDLQLVEDAQQLLEEADEAGESP